MAFSRRGGTRGLLRGRVANDIYSIGKDADGKNIQLVKAAPENVANPNTDAQIVNRMIMSQIYASMRDFVLVMNHSFEGVPYGQPSVTKFIELNYPLLREDVEYDWEESYSFGWQLKGRETVNCGPWIISQGSIVVPECIWCSGPQNLATPVVVNVTIRKPNATFGDLKRVMGAAAGDYFTVCGVGFDEHQSNARFYLLRHFLSADMADDTVLTSENIADAFTYEGNVPVNPQYLQATGSILTFLPNHDNQGRTVYYGAWGLIFSRHDGSKWLRSSCQLEYNEDFRWGVSPKECFASWKEAL